MEFVHIITTRFNVPTKEWSQTRSGKSPLSEEWHEHRFEVFRKFTLPSFKNQSNQDFVWLVFFDVNTAPKYKEIISEIQKEYPKFTPVFIEEFSQMQPAIIRHIKENTENTPFIITSDIDNDDMLHRDFTATVHQMFQPLHNLVIDVRSGIQLQIDKNKATAYLVNMASSPFVSLVEETQHAESVIKEPYHSQYRQYESYSCYDRQPLFIQFVHTYNMVNNIKTENKRLYRFDHKAFGMTDDHKFQISASNTFMHNTQRKIRLVWNFFLKTAKLKS